MHNETIKKKKKSLHLSSHISCIHLFLDYSIHPSFRQSIYPPPNCSFIHSSGNPTICPSSSSICPSIHQSSHSFLHLSVQPPIHLSTYPIISSINKFSTLSVYPPIHQSNIYSIHSLSHPSVSPPICPSIHPFGQPIHPSTPHLPIFHLRLTPLFICMPIHPFTDPSIYPTMHLCP